MAHSNSMIRPRLGQTYALMPTTMTGKAAVKVPLRIPGGSDFMAQPSVADKQ